MRRFALKPDINGQVPLHAAAHFALFAVTKLYWCVIVRAY
jgi:hypothetical protein